MVFPDAFMWGAATSSYQIEGASREDGRGESIWDRFSHTPGHIHNNEHGDIACDHYHRYREDVAIMRGLGLRAYRFSISWPRVLPRGTGTANAAGIDFYDRLVDELLRAEIEPFATLYHWDLPQALQDRGGWENPESVRWFADYADLMARTLGDRVQHWITHNEPWVIAFLGNWYGVHAPGKRDFATALRVAHHLLLSHGAAVPVIRQRSRAAQVGITVNMTFADTASEAAQDHAAAERYDGFHNRWFLDPLYRGRYPADMVALYGGHLSGIDLDAVAAAAVPTDFLGINYYTRTIVAADETPPLHARQVQPDHAAFTAMGWEVYPQGLTRLLKRVHQDYAPGAIYITENGAASDDPPPQDGIVEDPQRVAFLSAHLDALADALAAGVPVRGYFAWSLLDNFEWAEGYARRFGLYYVDFTTLERTPKRSARYYRERIKR